MGQESTKRNLENLEVGDEYYIGDPDRGGKIFARGATVPSDEATGYAKGCLFIHSDATDDDEADTLYVNLGTVSDANFNAATIAAD